MLLEFPLWTAVRSQNVNAIKNGGQQTPGWEESEKEGSLPRQGSPLLCGSPWPSSSMANVP